MAITRVQQKQAVGQKEWIKGLERSQNRRAVKSVQSLQSTILLNMITHIQQFSESRDV